MKSHPAIFLFSLCFIFSCLGDYWQNCQQQKRSAALQKQIEEIYRTGQAAKESENYILDQIGKLNVEVFKENSPPAPR